MSVRNETITDKFGYTRPKMYIDEIDNQDIFEFFKKNSPYGKGFGFTQEAVQNYQFRDGNVSYKKELAKKECFYTPKHTVALGNVMAWFTYDDFSCVYHDYTKNEIDFSDEWCKFVCGKVSDPDYLSDYQDLMHQKMKELQTQYNEQLNAMKDQLNAVIDIALSGSTTEKSTVDYDDQYFLDTEDGYDDNELLSQTRTGYIINYLKNKESKPTKDESVDETEGGQVLDVEGSEIEEESVK